jgi:RNA polymerase sigma-70 factor (ECF subfamily)
MAASEVSMKAVRKQVGFMEGRTGAAARERVDSDVVAGTTRADGAMERYACGDDAAFAELYDELAPRLYRFAARRARSWIAAEDVVQNTFLQVHAARERFVRGAAVVPWAYAIARRLLVEHGRRGGRERLRVVGGGAERPPAAPSADEALARGRLEAAALPTRWREAFELVNLEGLSVAEAAQVLGATRVMVRIRVFRATAALRDASAGRAGGDLQEDSRWCPPQI